MTSGAAAVELEQEIAALSGMVIEREREIRVLGERLREANECHDRSIASLERSPPGSRSWRPRPAARRPGSG